MTHHRLPSLLALTVLAGCGGGGGVGNVDLRFGLESQLRAATWQGIDADGSALTVETAELVLERIDLELPAGAACDPSTLEAPVQCDDDGAGEASIEIEGPFVVDLAAGTVEPSLDGITIPEGTYEHLDLRLSTDAAGGPSFTASGTLAGGEPWELALEIDEDARFESVGGVQVSGATDMLVWLDVGLWFADAPVSSCLDDGLLAESGGTVLLDDSAGCDLLDPIEDAVKDSGRVEGSDDDHAEVED